MAKYYLDRLCRFDGFFMDAHPELYNWIKCRICTYSRLEKPLITLEKYLMGRDKDDRYKAEYSQEIEKNAQDLLDKVNLLLSKLEIKNCEVTSGWRPSAVNSKISGAAKKSLHMIGKAVDIKDENDELKQKIMDNIDLLSECQLWMEHPDSTKGWCHLDIGVRKERKIRVFRP